MQHSELACSEMGHHDPSAVAPVMQEPSRPKHGHYDTPVLHRTEKHRPLLSLGIAGLERRLIIVASTQQLKGVR